MRRDERRERVALVSAPLFVDIRRFEKAEKSGKNGKEDTPTRSLLCSGAVKIGISNSGCSGVEFEAERQALWNEGED